MLEYNGDDEEIYNPKKMCKCSEQLGTLARIYHFIRHLLDRIRRPIL